MPEKQHVMKSLKETGVVAVIRADDAADLVDVGHALCAGGVKHIEITMTVPSALGVIEKSVTRLNDREVYIGAGTVLDGETARFAILAGASYIVSPVFRPDVVAVCKRYGIAVMPGAMTPGSPPCMGGGWGCCEDLPGGSRRAAVLQGPERAFPHIEIMPTGAVSRETAPQFIKAGACAIGVGGELVGKSLIMAREFPTITQNARDFVALVMGARAK